MYSTLEASNLLKDITKSSKFTHTSQHGSLFLKNMLPVLAERLESVLVAPSKGRTPLVVSTLDGLDTHTISLITLVTCLSSLAEPMNKLSLAARVSKVIVQELNYSTLEAANPGLIKGIQKYRKNFRAQRCVRDAVEGGVFGDVKDQLIEWEIETQHHVGLVLLKILEEMGVIDSVLVPGSRSPKYQWSLDVQSWADDTFDRCLYLNPNYMPLTSEPKDYDDKCLNHSYGDSFPPVRFRLKGNHKTADDTNTAPSEQGINLDTANRLGKVAYQLDDEMFDIIKKLWDLGHEVGGLPTSKPEELLPYPEGGSDEVIAEWKSRASRTYIKNAHTHGQRLYISRQIAIFEGYKGKPLHFLWQADSRGRLYPLTSTLLNPQGSDLSKSLLSFRQGKPLGEQGYIELKRMVAEYYGIDKVSMDEREQWVDDNWTLVQSVPGEAVNYPHLWSNADSPFLFLKACKELLAANQLDDPTQYISHLPRFLDGKCSGAQHWALHLLDSDIANSTGMTQADDDDVPPDLYSECLISLLTALNESKENEPYHEWWAALSREGKLDRSLIKRPTMTYVYGSTANAWTQHIYEWCKGKGIEGEMFDTDEGYTKSDLYSRCGYLSKLIKPVLAKRLSAVSEGMAWMKKACQTINKNQSVDVSWTTPGDFKVTQRYRKQTSKRINIVSQALGLRMQHTVQYSTPEVDVKAQATAIAPNYIHSMDATHLSAVVLDMSDLGHDVQVIHDSFGTHLCDVDILRTVIKKNLIHLYDGDPLSELKDYWENMYGVTLPDLPQRGDYDTADLLEACYDFS